MDVEQKTNTVLVASDDVCEGGKRGRGLVYWLGCNVELQRV